MCYSDDQTCGFSFTVVGGLAGRSPAKNRSFWPMAAKKKGCEGGFASLALPPGGNVRLKHALGKVSLGSDQLYSWGCAERPSALPHIPNSGALGDGTQRVPGRPQTLTKKV